MENLKTKLLHTSMESLTNTESPSRLSLFETCSGFQTAAYNTTISSGSTMCSWSCFESRLWHVHWRKLLNNVDLTVITPFQVYLSRSASDTMLPLPTFTKPTSEHFCKLSLYRETYIKHIGKIYIFTAEGRPPIWITFFEHINLTVREDFQ